MMDGQAGSVERYDRLVEADDPLARIAERIAPGARVLDIGCAVGLLGKLLATRGCVCDGVELDAEAAAKAQLHYRRVIVADLETIHLAEVFDSGAYDVVVCADVLEHLRAPARLLHQFRDVLKADGRALLSVPNIAYVGVVVELIAGEFEYRSNGVLDDTHLRFFTRNSLLRLLADEGYGVAWLGTRTRALTLSEFHANFEAMLPAAVLDAVYARPDALTYQFIAEITPAPIAANAEIESGLQAPGFGTQVFWSDDGKTFDESNSVRLTAALGCDRQTLRFPLPAAVHPPRSLRVDLGDRPGVLRFYGLTLRDAAGGRLVRSWRLDDLLTIASWNETIICRALFGDDIIATGYDSHLVIPLDDSLADAGSTSGWVLELEFGAPRSPDFERWAGRAQALARDATRLGTLEQQAREQVAQLAALREQVQLDQAEMDRLLRSHSWRVTAPLRAARRAMENLRPALAMRARALYQALPVSMSTKLRVKDALFTRLPWLFQHTRAYAAWRAFKGMEPVAVKGIASGQTLDWLYTEAEGLRVEYAEQGRIRTTIRTIAFYLPQFHPIPENDRWWGSGFTEWANVTRAKPQYQGHYQPRLPDELGFYDLRLAEVQRRQVELARNYGISGFCFYIYWFGGKRLLERPVESFLARSELDLGFCLCWANENWSRRWDGRDADLLIGQQHSPEDDLAFIAAIAPAFGDPRYIRVDGRPLLILYRPLLLPDARATAERWRTWCRDNGYGEICLALTESFDKIDPRIIGFDAAIEFPPNNHPAPVITDQMAFFNERFGGVVYDYRFFVEHSQVPRNESFTLWRGAFPSWDNEARRRGRGASFAHATPAHYGRYLENICAETVRQHPPGQRLVFINAWNEWAEGAHLEPDRRHGYAYLQATADVLRKFPEGAVRRIVCVSHDAHLHGAQILVLNLLRELRDQFGFHVTLLLCGPGDLVEEYERAAAEVVHCYGGRISMAERRERLTRLREQGAEAALCNTCVNGEVVEELAGLGFRTVVLVHELPELIRAKGLEDSVARIMRHADHVVFPAEFVRARVATVVSTNAARMQVLPQGLYQRNPYRHRVEEARATVRCELGLAPDARVVLGVGYADRRKGADLFAEVASQVTARDPDCCFVWVGKVERDMEVQLHERHAELLASGRLRLLGVRREPGIYFASADLYLLTSREDPYPSVVLESLNAGVPVVGFDGAGGFTELLARGGGRLVSFEDTAAMVGCVNDLLANPELCAALGAEGRGLVDEDYSFRDYVYALLDLAGQGFRRVSVVVPNYNYARFITARLDSILAQTYPIYELIFLDDTSSDDSVERAREALVRSGVVHHVIVNRENQGVYRQWLNGMRRARGELLWIAEADDLCEPTLVERLLACFADDSVVLAYCQSRQIDDDGVEIAPDYLDYTRDIDSEKWRGGYVRAGLDEIADTLAVKNTIPNVSAVLMRKPDASALEGGLMGFRNAGDYWLYVQLLRGGRIAFVAESLNSHRRHRASVTIGGKALRLMQEILQVQREIETITPLSDDTRARIEAMRDATYRYLKLDRETGLTHYAEHPELKAFLDDVS